jgi:hypothetical protein
MPRAARAIGALTAGLVVAWGIVLLTERLLAQWPSAPGDEPGDPAAYVASFGDIPPVPGAIAVAGWALATFGGASTAAALVEARQALLAVIIAVTMIFITVLRLIVRPHPFWYSTAMLAAVLVAASASRALALRRSAAAGP